MAEPGRYELATVKLWRVEKKGEPDWPWDILWGVYEMNVLSWDPGVVYTQH